MAQRALPSGTVQRRAFFGLLDADGWALAFIKGMFWFGAIMFLLGYVPNAVYKLTVNQTVNLGANIISPINLCDGSNMGLECPAQPGAVVPWQPSPIEIALPGPRARAVAFSSGTEAYLVGGLVSGQASASVLTATTTADGNFAAPWQDGPALPDARVDATLVMFNGVPYVIGGLNGAGEPAATVLVGTIDKGKLTGWTDAADLKLPVALSGAAAVVDAHGIWLIGGRTADGVLAAVYRSLLDTTVKPSKLKLWTERPELALPSADGQPNGRADAVGARVGDFIYLIGGDTALGPTGEVLRLQLDDADEPVRVGEQADAAIQGWGLSLDAQSLPEARVHATGFANSNVIYVVGGTDATGKPTTSTYFAVPNATSGDIGVWERLKQDELPGPRSAAAPLIVGSFVFLVGGQAGEQHFIDSFRADLAPKAPFFRLGILGATVPGLALEDEIGIQIGEIGAATVGVINMALLAALAVILSRHRLRARILEKLSRGRYRAPREDEYTG